MRLLVHVLASRARFGSASLRGRRSPRDFEQKPELLRWEFPSIRSDSLASEVLKRSSFGLSVSTVSEGVGATRQVIGPVPSLGLGTACWQRPFLSATRSFVI